jgi:hypothetical protein
MDVIAPPFYPVFKIGEDIIWDFTELEEAYLNELLTGSEILRPKLKDENYITFCKCAFNVKSLIHERATSNEILASWNIAINELKLDSLTKLSLRDSLFNLYLTKYLLEEPDLILMIRMVYWYNRCRRLEKKDTFKHKITEIKGKLTKGLLKKRDKINRRLDVNAIEPTSVNALVQEWREVQSKITNDELSNIQELRSKSRVYREDWFKNIWSITSELLLAALCMESGFDITFEPLSKQSEHDYDFIVDAYPVQVKTPNKPYPIKAFVDAKKKRKRDVDDNKITRDVVVNGILESIANNIGSIDEALSQGATIVFLNDTASKAGSYFSQYCLETGNFFSTKDAMNQSLGLLRN